MRVVFMGTPDFAVPTLEALAGAHDVVSVYTQPDRQSGRGRKVTPPAVKQAALDLGLAVRQPERLTQDEADLLAGDEPDVVCVAAYGLILPQYVLDVPQFGTINVHASLLPRHRGAAPIERAILEGDPVAGVSIMLMEATLDTGPVAATAEIPVGDHTATSLAEALARLGAATLLDFLASLESGNVVWVPQDDALSTYADKIKAEDVALEPSQGTDTFLRRVRASSRRAPARLSVCGTKAVIVEAERVAEPAVAPGAVAAGNDLVLGTSDGAVRVVAMRPENRGQMSGDAFMCGLKGDAPREWIAAS